jgi:hypothetical protein
VVRVSSPLTATSVQKRVDSRAQSAVSTQNGSGARDLNPGPHGPEPQGSSSSHAAFERFRFGTSSPVPDYVQI